MDKDVAEATDSLEKDTGLVELEGPMDQLDLTKMLAKDFEEQGSEETSPSGDAVEDADQQEMAPEAEQVLSQEESETESDPEPEGEQPEWFQRRIDRFTKKLRLAEEERDEMEEKVKELESKLDDNQQLPTAPADNPLVNVKTEKDLQDQAKLSEARLQFAEDMEDLLLENPDEVEQVLKKQGVELKDGEGYDDFSMERMTKFIRGVRRDSERKLNKWIPQKSQELSQSKEFNAQAEKLYPWLRNGDSQEMKVFNQVLAQSPQAAYAPNYKLELARYVRGYMAELADQQRVTPRKGVVPEPGRPTSAPAPKEGKAAKYDSARGKLFSNRDQRSLTDYVGTFIGD